MSEHDISYEEGFKAGRLQGATEGVKWLLKLMQTDLTDLYNKVSEGAIYASFREILDEVPQNA